MAISVDTAAGPSRPGTAHGYPALWLRSAPLPLLGVGVLLGWLLTPELIEPARFQMSLAPTLALAVLRAGSELLADRLRPGGPVVLVGYVVHAVVLVVAVAFNPFVCIYAFLGFVDADRYFVSNRATSTAVVVTGLTCGFGQAGGLPGVSRTPALFAVLAGVNIVLALTMMRIGQSREREVAAREQAVDLLARAHAENLALQDRLLEQERLRGVTDERARLSRELHDTVAQGLVGVIRQLENLPAGLDADVRQLVERAELTARDCLNETRRAIRALAPQQLQDADLADALTVVLDDWSRAQGIDAELRTDGVGTPGPADEVVLRVIQEALANVAHHAQARSVTLLVSWLSDQLVVDLHDDGVGFDPATVARGRGLDGMAERLAAVSGRLLIESHPGGGTTIAVVIPR